MYVASVYRVIGVLTRKFVVDPAYRNQGIGCENSHVLLREIGMPVNFLEADKSVLSHRNMT